MEQIINTFGFVFAFLLLLAIVFIPLIISVIIVRWLFRINNIVNLLTEISTKLTPLHPVDCAASVTAPEETAECDRCRQSFPLSTLIELKIGKTVCPVCNKLLNLM